MDHVDRVILRLLQRDGRMSITELASQVGLAVSSCHRRVRDLEAAGVLTGYTATVSPKAVGLGFEAVVFVHMNSSQPDTLEAFEAAVQDLPNVVSAERLFGQPDYMLRVLAVDIEAYQHLYDSTLGSLPGVQLLTSTLVMKRITAGGPVPV